MPRTSAPAQRNGVGALDQETRRLHALWITAKERLAAHRVDTVRAGERLTTVREAYIEAQVAGAAARVTALRSERGELEERLATAAAVEAGLVERVKQSGLAWSSAWTAWSDGLKVELFGPLEAKRERLAAAEADAAEQYARRVAEMPT
jgi:hypothetical protein